MCYNPKENIDKLKKLIEFCEYYQYSILRVNLLENYARVLVNESCDILTLTYNKVWKNKYSK
ncbi:hypothetical protein [Clostridium perfringens]|uniref:hypothetical protein n=1 Tax=Clostridium perfringens TaxID=1502 RepID=UPI002340A551|nr:hypothetical protein [Clostridium perfringens]MDC4245607.1 hypothetical protein [Clostridium perfringens]